MTDYISRQAAIDEACKWCNIEFSDEGCEPSDCEIKKRLINIPSADVVEVVRCRDCKHADKYYHCTYMNKWNTADGFCYCGRKR